MEFQLPYRSEMTDVTTAPSLEPEMTDVTTAPSPEPEMTDVTTAPSPEPEMSKSLASHFFKIHFNIILLCTSINPWWSLQFRDFQIHLANPPCMLHVLSLTLGGLFSLGIFKSI